MKKLNKLFKITKTGRVRQFYIVVDYHNNDSAIILQYSSQLGGKITIAKKYINEGSNIGKSNELSAYDRAVLLADGIYNDKYGEGYKSKQMYIDTYTFSDTPLSFLEALPEESFADLVVSKCKYNTNKDGFPLPMLAEPIKKRKINFLKMNFIQPKLNGVRGIVSYKDDKVYIMSRGGEYYNIDNISERMNELFKNELFKDIIFDGELYKHGKPLQEISGAARTELIDLFNTRDWIEYHIYDIVDNKLSQFERFKILKLVKSVISNSYISDKIKIVRTKLVKSQEEVDSFHEEVTKQGYEGAILRTNEVYLPSFRDSRLLKLKEFIDGEFELINCEAKEEDIGASFVFILKNDITSKTFKCRPTGSLEQKEFWYKNIEQLKGKRVTVRYQERSIDYIPTMAHVRAKGPIFEAIRDYE